MKALEPETLLFAAGVALSAAGARSFRNKRFLASLQVQGEVSLVWIGYVALSKSDGRWAFARFAPAALQEGGRYAARVDVEDFAGAFDGRVFRHTTVVAAIVDGRAAMGVGTASQAAALGEDLDADTAQTLVSALESGDELGIFALLAGRRYLTVSTDGVLAAYPSGRQIGSARVEVVLEYAVPARYGMDTLSVIPHRGF